MKMLTTNRVTTVALAVGTVVVLYNWGPTRNMMFERGWFGG